ncbi:hypothetical protein [Rhizobium aegyptiacum]|uniref:hypothetical protein n=1 Tax=Rhizobium aegyptiacum TaxID=1764550 RepID=UPI000B2CB340|nr:hypothetical protein [Rhizobium aegyptiacum]
MRGVYQMEFTGRAGQGVGTLTFADGKLAGLDAAGGVYKGEFSTTPGGEITGYADLNFPNGGQLVTGAIVAAGSAPMRIPFAITQENAEGHILRIETPTGPVNVRLTLISAL